MKPLSDSLRQKIDLLRKSRANNADSTWEVQIFRNREKMMGQIEGAQITAGNPQDMQPTIAQDEDGRYIIAFSRNGTIYEMRSKLPRGTNVEWNDESPLFNGEDPDLDFYGEFTTTGRFDTQELMMAYEYPVGTILFRKRIGGIWQNPITVGPGKNPSIVRGWADPPEVGTNDQGLVMVYTRNGDLYYTHSDDEGATWADEIELDNPVGGTKKSAQIMRLADFTLGIIYEYDNGLTSEIWFYKTTRKYVNIASPDENVSTGLGRFRHYEFEAFALTMEEHTVDIGVGNFRQASFAFNTPAELGAEGDGSGGGTDGYRETASVGVGNFRQVTFTGVNP